MTPQEITHYSELMARFEGLELTGDKVIIGWDLTNKPFLSDTNYHKSYDWLHRVWVKFRDLKFETTGNAHNDYDRKVTFNVYCSNVVNAITYSSPEEAFLELGRAIEWYEQINKPGKH